MGIAYINHTHLKLYKPLAKRLELNMGYTHAPI